MDNTLSTDSSTDSSLNQPNNDNLSSTMKISLLIAVIISNIIGLYFYSVIVNKTKNNPEEQLTDDIILKYNLLISILKYFPFVISLALFYSEGDWNIPFIIIYSIYLFIFTIALIFREEIWTTNVLDTTDEDEKLMNRKINE
tara:strand:- start:797 stop:1222 length:426 start_codon:yes stop_codon:yes gene_type:complete